MNFTRRTITRRFTSAFRILFRTALLVSVFASFWQAPVPWLHRHCADSENIDEAQLALHLRSLHAGAVERGYGWHIHFVMLDAIVRGAGLPVPTQDGDSPVSPKEHVVLGDHYQGETSSHASLPLLVYAVDQITPRSTQFPCLGDACDQFLGDRASSCRLHIVLCVARC